MGIENEYRSDKQYTKLASKLYFFFSYECPDFTKYDKTKCYLNGKTFNVGDDIADNDLPNCRASCRCIQNDDEAANIVCADIECPENFHRDWNCVSQYDDLKQCCRSGEICGNFL